MAYWLVKSEPFKYSWQQLLADGKTMWDGVRNYQARNNLQAMKKGDQVLFYHSNEGLEIVGIAEVLREAYPDPTTKDSRWVVVDLKPLRTLRHSVPLSLIKQTPELSELGLVRQGRLSVLAVQEQEFRTILKLARDKA